MSELKVDFVVIGTSRTTLTCKRVEAVSKTGEFAVCPSHSPFFAHLVPGKVRIVAESGDTRVFETGEGIFQVESDQVTILTNSVQEFPE